MYGSAEPLAIRFGTSKCCQSARVLVRSMEGGFVTANCVKCNKSEKDLSESDFVRAVEDITILCPWCKRPMTPGKDKNYGFRCGVCNRFVDVADMLPRWDEVGGGEH